MNDRSSQQRIAETIQKPRPAGLNIGLALGWLVLAGVVVLVWRVQRSVRATLAPRAPAAAVSGPVRGTTVLRHAQRFAVEERADSRLVRVFDPNSTGGGAQYQLVPRGRRAAPIDAKTVVIEVPVRRVIALSTTYVTAFTRLGVQDRLIGLAGVKLLNTPELVEQAHNGHLVEVGDGNPSMELNLDLELIRSLAPDLVIASYLGNTGAKLREAGLNVVENSEWLESTPLGRAEWIKFIAAFLERDAEAERWFTGLEQRYEAMAARTRQVIDRPSVLCGIDYRGTWHIPGGQSYVARFIADAGGDYLWKDEKSTGSRPLKMEAVLERAQHAKLWLVNVISLRSRKEIADMDPRYALFDAFNAGRLYNTDARVSPGGGNDYWENGVANPDLVLADLIAIIHPELSQGHTLRWYRTLPEEAVR
jgi:iron complex transport system substrate-binding protein